MVEKDLKKLSRAELLELLLVQTKEAERLRERLKRREEELENRNLQVQEAGNLANACLAINGVMAAAQAAAQQYLDNIAAMEKKTEELCLQMLEQARQEADQIRRGGKQPEAGPETDQMLSEIYQLLDKS